MEDARPLFECFVGKRGVVRSDLVVAEFGERRTIEELPNRKHR